MSHKTTSFQTFMHLLNGYVGSGILAMPKAFSDGGLVFSSICTPFIGLLSNYCIHMLVQINGHLCEKLSLSPLDYEELAENSFVVGPKRLRKYSKVAKFITSLFIILTQLGGCSVYYLFIADNIQSFAEGLELFGSDPISIEVYLSILLPVMILLCFVKNIKHLSIASTLANILQLVGIAIIVYNLVTDIPPVIDDRRKVGTKLPLFFVTTLFIFEGITISMPLYKSMKEPKNFGKLFGVLNFAIIIVISFYFMIGFFGYVKYGDDVKASITLSLPEEPLYEFVQLCYAFAVMLTYPIVLYVPIEMLWPTIQRKLNDSKRSALTITLADYGFRAFLVSTTFMMAALIPELDLVISLVGAITSSSIAVTIPSILHTVAFWEERTNKYSRIWLFLKNGIITLIGLVGFVLGTYFSIDDIVKALSHGYS